MMLLDTDLIIKRIAIIVVALIVSAVLGAAVWYNSNLKNLFDEGITETNILKEETNKLGETTLVLRNTLDTTTKELRKNLQQSNDDTKKIDSEVKQQFGIIKVQQGELDKLKVEIRTELQRLRETNNNTVETIKLKEQNLVDQLKIRDAQFDRYKIDSQNKINMLLETIAAKDKEINELRNRLDKEIEWRNKNFWQRVN